jgi:hypothetical protein
MRDLVRVRIDAMMQLMRARQQLLAFLLRHRRTYETGKNWTLRHRRTARPGSSLAQLSCAPGASEVGSRSSIIRS